MHAFGALTSLIRRHNQDHSGDIEVPAQLFARAAFYCGAGVRSDVVDGARSRHRCAIVSAWQLACVLLTDTVEKLALTSDDAVNG
jgi:hypothetical protein